MAKLYFAPVLFFFISFTFSMLGMGGSQLYIPILYWLGMDFKTQAIPLGMLLNVVNSSSAAFTYIRKKLPELKVAIPFGISMVIFPPVGTIINSKISVKPVILTFALFTASAGLLMLSGWKPKRKNLTSKQKFLFGIFAGSILGFFAGFIGRGGGSFVVPILYIFGLQPKIAAATSSVIVSFSGTSSFLSHIFTSAKPMWKIWSLCVAAVLVGSQSGSRFMAAKLNSKSVKLIFGFVLIGISLILIIKDVILK
ncbi:sulfite exporter TauE/SafE family protein [bacterium]|nr:sulfite exporter TauE/SafE family protein [bacterium]